MAVLSPWPRVASKRTADLLASSLTRERLLVLVESAWVRLSATRQLNQSVRLSSDQCGYQAAAHLTPRATPGADICMRGTVVGDRRAHRTEPPQQATARQMIGGVVGRPPALAVAQQLGPQRLRRKPRPSRRLRPAPPTSRGRNRPGYARPANPCAIWASCAQFLDARQPAESKITKTTLALIAWLISASQGTETGIDF